VANARISRARHFSLFAIGEVAATLISSSVAIMAAFSGFGPWSLVFQQVVLWSVKILWLMPNSHFFPKLVFKPALLAPYLGFGFHAAGANLLDFATRYAPTMIIGPLLGISVLGHYSMANQIIRVP